MRYRTTMVVGDLQVKLGVSGAKGLAVKQAITNARPIAQRTMIDVKMKGKTIPHEIEAKFGAAKVLIKPAVAGHVLVAGGGPRIDLKLACLKDITAKCLGSSTNKLNYAVATIMALKTIRSK